MLYSNGTFVSVIWQSNIPKKTFLEENVLLQKSPSKAIDTKGSVRRTININMDTYKIWARQDYMMPLEEPNSKQQAARVNKNAWTQKNGSMEATWETEDTDRQFNDIKENSSY